MSACARRRTYQFAEEIARDSDLMEQIEGLSSDLAQGVGGEGYAAELVEGGETITFGSAELVAEVLKSLGGIKQLSEASPVAVGVFGSVLLSAVSFNGVLKSGDKAGPMSWKFGAGKPEAIPVPEPDGDDEPGCAKDDDEKVSNYLRGLLIYIPSGR